MESNGGTPAVSTVGSVDTAIACMQSIMEAPVIPTYHTHFYEE